MRRQRFRSDGFILVITLIMIALAAIIVIALVTNASLDRLTAASYQDRYQAELAAQNGLEAAKRALSTDGKGASITNDDTFVVVRVPGAAGVTAAAEDTTAHYYFIGQTKAGSTQVTYFPLFSGGGSSQSVAIGGLPKFTPIASSDPQIAPNLPTVLADPSASASPSPAPPLIPAVTTQWTDVPNPPTASATAPRLRYCYWVEDLGGYIDADTAGNTFGMTAAGSADKTHTRDPSIMQPLIDAGTTPVTSLVAMWTLFNPADPTDVTGSAEDKDNQSVVSQRGALFTSETVKQAIVSSTAASYLSKVSRHIVARTRPDSEQAVIPNGFSYGKEGTPKTDLNAKIAGKDVDGIATPIKDNLPTWASSRRGGFPYQVTADSAKADDSYRRTIAANIITYAQQSIDAPIAGNDYRGFGAYPLVNEYYDYTNWTGASANSITIEVTSWIELWNMTNQTITGDIKYTDYYRHALVLGAFTYFDNGHDPDKPDPGETISGYPFPTQTITMAPNEFRVVKFGPAVYTLSTGGTIPASPLQLQARTSGRYKLEWKAGSGANFVVVDQPLGGVQMNNDTIYNPPESSSHVSYKWNGSQPGFVYYGGVANFYYNPGDPRSAYYNNAPQASNDYSSNATMWTRNQKPSSTNPLAKEVKPSSWPDRGHETTLGTAGGKDTVPPSITAPAGVNTEPSKAPAVMSNAGKLKSAAELGNIYDPAQWNIVSVNNRWSQIDSNTTADSHYGGGLTLRVGRQEFTRFDNAGSRASQLMDLFSAGTRRETQGLININTATRDTLRALAAGLTLNRDSDIKAGAATLPLYPPTTTDQADKFADAVIVSRGSKPFVSTSQLAQLQALDASGKPATDSKGNPISFFGNPQQWETTQSAPPDDTWEWNDSGREEYFTRMFDLSSVRSRNFRVFVTGQYVDPRNPDASGKPKIISTVKKIYHVFLHPTRAADGSIQSQQADVTYERDL
ncbi:MAG: hypothetical protein QOH39_124 [Verrucomicrobiota bacterium]|jgi:hypothetical protein